MKEKKNIFLGLLIAASLLLTTGCPTPVDGGNGGGGTPPTAVTFVSAVAADGADGTENTTELTLTFSVDPTTLTADNITVTGATKGALSVSGTTRTLAISNITVANGETVSVAIANPSGYTISGSPKTAVVYKDLRVRVTYNAGTGNTSGTVPEDTTVYDVGNTVTVLDNTGNLVGALVGGDHAGSGIKQRFIGWNTDSGATTAEYGAGETFAITEDTTLYAIYTIGTDVLRKVGAGGGWVFYDAGSAQSWGRYLEVAPVSTEWTNKDWGDWGTTIGGNAALTGIGDGQAATEAIVAHMEGESITGTAAQLCDALSYGGYDDWFLPSKDELAAIWANLVNDGTGLNNGVGGFANEYYWSSSEHFSYADAAWGQGFYNGYQAGSGKIDDLRVRAVRAF